MRILGKKKQFMNRALKFSIKRIKIDRLKSRLGLPAFIQKYEIEIFSEKIPKYKKEKIIFIYSVT